MAEWLLAALTLAVVCAGLAAFAPRVVGRLPEPEEAPEDKISYAELAARPRLGLRLVFLSAVLGAAVGARLGWAPDLIFWALLVPVFVTLAWIDWHTKFLPTKIIAPTYVGLVGLLLLVSALPFGDGLDGLRRAAIGWAVWGLIYLVMWLIYPRGIGYGDVRLSGLIGLGLGHLGLMATVVGLYAGFVTGAVGGVFLTVFRGGNLKTKFSYGPFMVLGGFVAVLFAQQIGSALGY